MALGISASFLAEVTTGSVRGEEKATLARLKAIRLLLRRTMGMSICCLPTKALPWSFRLTRQKLLPLTFRSTVRPWET